MNEKKTIESQLNCKATAELKLSVEKDMEKEDGSLEELLNDTKTKPSDN